MNSVNLAVRGGHERPGWAQPFGCGSVRARRMLRQGSVPALQLKGPLGSSPLHSRHHHRRHTNRTPTPPTQVVCSTFYSFCGNASPDDLVAGLNGTGSYANSTACAAAAGAVAAGAFTWKEAVCHKWLHPVSASSHSAFTRWVIYGEAARANASAAGGVGVGAGAAGVALLDGGQAAAGNGSVLQIDYPLDGKVRKVWEEGGRGAGPGQSGAQRGVLLLKGLPVRPAAPRPLQASPLCVITRHCARPSCLLAGHGAHPRHRPGVPHLHNVAHAAAHVRCKLPGRLLGSCHPERGVHSRPPARWVGCGRPAGARMGLAAHGRCALPAPCIAIQCCLLPCMRLNAMPCLRASRSPRQAWRARSAACGGGTTAGAALTMHTTCAAQPA